MNRRNRPRSTKISTGSRPSAAYWGGVLDQQGDRDFEGIDTRSPGDLQPQGLQNLGDDQHCPNLLHDHDRLRRPQQVPVQVLFDQEHRQLNWPNTMHP